MITPQRQARFGRAFHAGLWAAYQAQDANGRRRVLLALMVLLVFVATGGHFEVLIGCSLIATVIWFGLHTPAPQGADLFTLDDRVEPAADHPPAAATAEVPGGVIPPAGELSYTDVVAWLAHRVDQDVVVQIRTSAAAKPAALLVGPLRERAVSEHDPAMFVAVSNDDTVFIIDPLEFAHAEVDPTHRTLRIVRRDGGVIDVFPRELCR